MMIGQSQSLRALQCQLRRFALCDAPVLLEGETGTGKELAAREIHYASRRRDKPFVPVNCGALPDSLIESELFGHCRGAFTDAKNAQPGLIDHAKHGTLFLDEVDSLSPKAQVTLLRFLQDNEYRPVGSGAQRTADVRIIAATNASLVRLVAEGRFRRDLLYRLNALHVRLPPLRERSGDVSLLADHFLRALRNRMDIAAERWTPEVLRAFEAYAWPGNVRELENVVLRTSLCAEHGDVGVTELAAAEPALVANLDIGLAGARPGALHAVQMVPDAFGDNATRRTPDERQPRLYALGETAAEYRDSQPAPPLDPPHERSHGATSFTAAKLSAIAAFERAYLIDLMRRAAGNVSVAARLCSVERRQLGKLLKKRGIEKKQFTG